MKTMHDEYKVKFVAVNGLRIISVFSIWFTIPSLTNLSESAVVVTDEQGHSSSYLTWRLRANLGNLYQFP